MRGCVKLPPQYSILPSLQYSCSDWKVTYRAALTRSKNPAPRLRTLAPPSPHRLACRCRDSLSGCWQCAAWGRNLGLSRCRALLLSALPVHGRTACRGYTGTVESLREPGDAPRRKPHVGPVLPTRVDFRPAYRCGLGLSVLRARSHFVLALATCYRLARDWKASPTAAMAAAVSYAFCGNSALPSVQRGLSGRCRLDAAGPAGMRSDAAATKSPSRRCLRGRPGRDGAGRRSPGRLSRGLVGRALCDRALVRAAVWAWNGRGRWCRRGRFG